MAELHQILAVEGDLKNRSGEAMADARAAFSSDALLGQTRRYAPLAEDGEPLPAEDKPLTQRVSQILTTVRGTFGEWLDVAMQKEFTNQITKANIMVDGKPLFEDVPAPALLNLEGKLLELRSLLSQIPTTDIAEQWSWDLNNNVWVSEPKTSYRTNKVPKALVVYEATKEHPAQVQTYAEDVRVGEWTTTKFSGAMSPVEKQEMLGRVDTLIKAVKQARQKANGAEVISVEMSEKLFAYIFGE